jgi:hypothetical protein
MPPSPPPCAEASIRSISASSNPPGAAPIPPPPQQLPAAQFLMPNKKQISIRRYWYLLCLSTALLAILTSFLNGYIQTSITPVLGLAHNYQHTQCKVVGIKLQHDVSIGLHSSFRGELSVVYNRTQSSNSESKSIPVASSTHATIHHHITGSYTTKKEATMFLNKYAIDQTIDCYTDKDSPYHATTSIDQYVFSSILVIVFILALFMVIVLLFICVTLKSFNHFVQKREWDAARGVWIQLNDTEMKDDGGGGRKT